MSGGVNGRKRLRQIQSWGKCLGAVGGGRWWWLDTLLSPGPDRLCGNYNAHIIENLYSPAVRCRAQLKDTITSKASQYTSSQLPPSTTAKYIRQPSKEWHFIRDKCFPRYQNRSKWILLWWIDHSYILILPSTGNTNDMVLLVTRAELCHARAVPCSQGPWYCCTSRITVIWQSHIVRPDSLWDGHSSCRFWPI